MSYQVQLPVFAGPLDLLLHLIERSELDIYDIPIALITGQFLAYLQTMEMLNLEVAGEFLVMAATLMQIKAKMLLPKPISLEHASGDLEGEGEEDPRRELVDRLVEFRRVKEAAELLRRCEEEQARYYPRSEAAEQDVSPPVTELGPAPSIWTLVDAFQALLAAAEPETDRVPVPVEAISVRQAMDELVQALAGAAGALEFREVFRGRKTRRSLVTTFIALLELIRTGRVIASQEGVYGRIFIRLRAAEVIAG